MSKHTQDPADLIRLRASAYPGVEEGSACTQSSFKVNKKSFLFIGLQGGRHKVMLKLKSSMPEAIKLAEQKPDCYGAGSTGWVTARFTSEDPIPQELWERWLDESYQLSVESGRKTSKKRAKKKVTIKK